MVSTNELGAMPILDGGVPRTISFKAREAISGGQFIVFSGTGTDVVSSGTNTFTSSDIEGALVTVSTAGSGIEAINGIALQDVVSGAFGTAATKGGYIVKCGSTVHAGTKLWAISNHSVMTVGSMAVPVDDQAGVGGVAIKVPGAAMIGRAITAGTSGTNKYCIAYLDF